MTDPETRAIPVDVVDREAARPWLHQYLNGSDLSALAEAFARHRITALETLAAEQQRNEKHRNDLADKITMQSVEIGALRSRATAAEARAETLDAENARLREVLEWIRMFASVRAEDSQKAAAKVQRGAMNTIVARVLAALSPFTQVAEPRP